MASLIADAMYNTLPALNINSTIPMYALPLSQEKFGRKMVDMSWKKAADAPPTAQDDRKVPVAPAAEPKSALVPLFKQLLRAVGKSDFAVPFLQPVREEDAPGYLDVISEPMDLTSLQRRVNAGHYNDLDEQRAAKAFAHDLNLLWQNCLAYNNPQSQIAQWSLSLLEDAKKICREMKCVAVLPLLRASSSAVSSHGSDTGDALVKKRGRPPKDRGD
ncbi:hypothetical protein EON64_21115, partial [archaeon]